MTFNQKALENLSPANFAFVMASGSVSLIFYKTGWLTLALLLLFVGMLGYFFLCTLFIWRFCVIKKKVLHDFKDVGKMFKYLTFSAGTNALAVSCLLFRYDLFGLILGVIGTISTVILTYTLFCTLFFHTQTSIRTISPFWLLLAIACHSTGIVLTTLWGQGMLSKDKFLLFAFGFWIFGVFIYLIFMTLNLFRMFFFPFKGQDMDPCYWTCMGAAAIAVVDGGLFVLVPRPPDFLIVIKPFIEGATLFLWCWGTAWIPILCLMELWKVAYFKIAFYYQPSRWAMVFPLGMYAAATDLLSSNGHLSFLHEIVPILLWITFISWCLVLYMSRLNPFANSTEKKSKELF